MSSLGSLYFYTEFEHTMFMDSRNIKNKKQIGPGTRSYHEPFVFSLSNQWNIRENVSDRKDSTYLNVTNYFRSYLKQRNML